MPEKIDRTARYIALSPVSAMERDMILAALRLYQAVIPQIEMPEDAEIDEIITLDAVEIAPLEIMEIAQNGDDDQLPIIEIDELCERINV
jgi:hypothetical protein